MSSAVRGVVLALVLLLALLLGLVLALSHQWITEFNSGREFCTFGMTILFRLSN
jgi:hypothetical protein